MANSGVQLQTLVLLVTLCFITSEMAAISMASLRVGYYKDSCPSAEAIVRRTVQKALSRNPGIGAGLIRMHFHDCFIRGCDASILLDSTPGHRAEKDHPANNPSLRGFEVIDKAKAALEAACPLTVSCADIIAFAARDSAAKLGNIKYKVPSGRRDGRTSLEADVPANLPSPASTINQLRRNFSRKGFSTEEMVTLSGAHSIGVAHCSSFSNRIHGFNSTNRQDPSLDSKFARQIGRACSDTKNSGDPTMPLDSVTANGLDNVYYKNLINRRGLLASDQLLMRSRSTAWTVRRNAKNGASWRSKFGDAMVKMGKIGVLTGKQGEIRKNCRVIN